MSFSFQGLPEQEAAEYTAGGALARPQPRRRKGAPGRNGFENVLKSISTAIKLIQTYAILEEPEKASAMEEWALNTLGLTRIPKDPRELTRAILAVHHLPRSPDRQSVEDVIEAADIVGALMKEQ